MYRYNRELLLVADGAEALDWQKALQEQGWNVHLASGREAMEAALQVIDPELILIDGTAVSNSLLMEMIHFACGCGEGTAVVPILSDATADSVLGCIRQGASDVLTAPVDLEELLAVTDSASQLKQVVRENQRYRDELENTNLELRESLHVLRQDQIAGRQVQQSMLPKTPQNFHGYQIAHHVVPSLYLSGDFVGYHLLLDRYLIFYFADVSGHGASSAFVTVLVRSMLNRIIRRHVIRKDEENLVLAPQGLAESLNRQLIATGLDKHMTLFAGSIDTRRNTLRYVVGAQMPAPIVVENGVARQLSGKGKPIGIFEDGNWQVHELELTEQFSLCVVSDGVFDYMPEGSIIDKEKALFDAVQSHGDSLESVCTSLGLNDIQEAPDDISILYLSRGGR